MVSATYRVYRAVLVRDDPVLAAVLASVDGGPDVFHQLAGSRLVIRPALVVMDRQPGAHPVRWRPTVTVSTAQGIPDLEVPQEAHVVVSDLRFPVALEAVPQHIVRSGDRCAYPRACGEAEMLVEMMAHFAQACHAREKAGLSPAEIAHDPQVRRLAREIHRRSIEFSAAYRQGVIPSSQFGIPPLSVRRGVPPPAHDGGLT